MISFGIMSLNSESEQTYVNEIARHAKICGIECYRFVPTDINPVTLLVKGKKFNPNTESWSEADFPIPALLYDRCFYGDDDHSKQCLPIVSWLKSRKDITFLGYGLPNKLELYEALKNTVLSPYLPKTSYAADTTIVLKELSLRQKIILKPINGSRGYGIYYLRKNEKTCHVTTEKNQKIISRIFPNEQKLLRWLRPLINKRKYLVQPYLELSNMSFEPFDIRVLLQKNKTGDWRKLGAGVRVGCSGGILSNLSAGGRVISYEDWAARIPASQAEYLREELTFILKNLPVLLEEAFLPLFEIGVDIGVAKDGSIWILDVNSKPGRKVLLQTEPDLKEQLHLSPLLYGKFLSQSEQKERKRYHANTLSH